MKRIFPIYLLAALVSGMMFSSCDDKDDDVMDGADDSMDYAVMVTSFKLVKNDSVLANLDSVFFSIDLDKAVVFNADSLPRGTKVNRLPVEMTLYNVKKAEIVMPGKNGADTTVNYLTNSMDSIDFSRGSVKLNLTSANEKATRTYTIYVNVHKMAPDSLAWGDMAFASLPTTLTAPKAQKTVEYDGRILCFVSDGTAATKASCVNPNIESWTIESVTLPAGARVETVTAGTDKLYLLTADNQLFTSTDGGASWTQAGAEMTHIYGVYQDKVVGVKRDASGQYLHVTYPATNEVPVAAKCPVEGTSQTLTYTSEWSDSPMMLMMGGVTASGEAVGDMWGFDGSEWACTSIAGIKPASGVAIFPYYAFRTSSTWVVTKNTVLMAFGGADQLGRYSRTVYVSSDRGVHWSKAGTTLQLPAGFPEIAGAQAIVVNRTMDVASTNTLWSENVPMSLPSWYVPVVNTRATKPITEWECPFIFVFGGETPTGELNDNVWRGVINRLMFKPLQ